MKLTLLFPVIFLLATFETFSQADMTLSATQTNSGPKTFLDGTLLLRNTGNTFSSQFTNTNTAARSYSLPDFSGSFLLSGGANLLQGSTSLLGSGSSILSLGTPASRLYGFGVYTNYGVSFSALPSSSAINCNYEPANSSDSVDALSIAQSGGVILGVGAGVNFISVNGINVFGSYRTMSKQNVSWKNNGVGTAATAWRISLLQSDVLKEMFNIDANANGRAQFFGPIRLMNYVTGSLPSAATHIYSLSYDKTLERPVFSNGSIWTTLQSATDINGLVKSMGITQSQAIAGTDYETPLVFSGDLSRSANLVSLSPSGVTAGNYTNANISVDVNGRITGASNGNSSQWATNGTSINYSAGNVGIGTELASNPNGYKLAVNGKIGAKDVQVETSSATWPDYVFTPQYSLPSLANVERFIKENNHLENVPSASEIEKDGHSLGEMDKILLKKVEELTLYIIQQQKEIDALKKKIEGKE